ncbi:Conserved_hypothetical protein [Hexamita inflata]|uniref:Uncharacterized protein n=1 Tax=Hexamita inflata TaxID=28002 RepID=A0AA86NJE4_9EUKA|nr:Conserved hypothetical protein [Hexamita inflata]
MKPTEICHLAPYDLRNVPSILLDNKFVVIGSDVNLLVLDRATGILCGRTQIQSSICSLASTTYNQKKVIIVLTQQQLLCYSFNVIKVNVDCIQLPTFRFKLEFQIVINQSKSPDEEPVSCQFSQQFQHLGIIVFDNNTGIVVDLITKRITFKIQGMCPQAAELTKIFSLDEKLCMCAELHDKFTDILDELDNKKTKSDTVFTKLHKFLANRDEICIQCQQQFMKKYKQLAVYNEPMHVYGTHALPYVQQLHCHMSYRVATGSSELCNDFYKILILEQNTKQLDFLVYGAYPEILIYSIPLDIMKAQQSVDVVLNLFPNKRLSGKFQSYFVTEDLVTLDLTQMPVEEHNSQKIVNRGFIKVLPHFQSHVQLMGQATFYSDVLNVFEDKTGIIVQSASAGLQHYQLDLEAPLVCLQGLPSFDLSFKSQRPLLLDFTNQKSIFEIDTLIYNSLKPQEMKVVIENIEQADEIYSVRGEIKEKSHEFRRVKYGVELSTQREYSGGFLKDKIMAIQNGSKEILIYHYDSGKWLYNSKLVGGNANETFHAVYYGEDYIIAVDKYDIFEWTV